MNLQPFLKDLEERIVPDSEEKLEKEWRTFAAGEWQKPFFSPSRPPNLPNVYWPDMPINHAFQDESHMIYHQLRLASDELASGGGALLNVRPNYGTGIIPSMFGAELFYLADELDTLACTRPFPDGEQGIRRVMESQRIDYEVGLAVNVFRFGQMYREAIKQYPLISRYVHMYNPDLQGPFPLVDALWGSDIYMAFYDEEELLHGALKFFSEIYLDFTKRWQSFFPPLDAQHSIEWGLFHNGRTIIRNDAVMNISGNMYQEFVMPMDQHILQALGGGIHFCGKGDHYIQHVCAMERISCINLSQPHLNDMETIYQHSIDKGICIIGMPAQEVERAMAAGRNLRGLVHSGASLAAWEKKE